jgi:hypothetical protein
LLLLLLLLLIELLLSRLRERRNEESRYELEKSANSEYDARMTGRMVLVRWAVRSGWEEVRVRVRAVLLGLGGWWWRWDQSGCSSRMGTFSSFFFFFFGFSAGL